MPIRSKILLFFMWMVTAVPVYTQNIIVSDEINLKNDYAYEFLGSYQGQLLLFRDRAFTYEISTFDEQMRLKWERELDFEKRRIDMIGTSFQDSLFHIFYSFREREQRHLRMNTYDVNAFIKDTVTIAVDEQMATGAKWRFSRSEDHSKVILFGPAEKKEIRFICYDAHEKEMLWDLTVPFADTLSGKDFKQLLISDRGEMFLVLENFGGGLTEAKYHQEIWTYGPGSNQMDRLDIKLEDRVAQHTRFVCDNLNHRIYGVSMIADRDQGRSKGLLLMRVEGGDKAFSGHSLDAFNEELLQELYGQESRVPKGIADFEIRDLVLREDGGVIVILELIREYTRKPSYPYSNIRNDNPLNFRRWVDYYHEDLLVMSYGPGGERDWSTILRKKQYSQDDEGVYSSYYLFRTPSFIHLVYNDEIRNENTVSEYVLNGDGEFVRNSLLSTASQRLKLRFRDAIQTGPNSFVVPSERTNRLMLVKFVY